MRKNKERNYLFGKCSKWNSWFGFFLRTGKISNRNFLKSIYLSFGASVDFVDEILPVLVIELIIAGGFASEKDGEGVALVSSPFMTGKIISRMHGKKTYLS